ncbi:Mis6-domain-containing protein [Amniculicola lignicola CBS 123094]|uniref:Mis6-domain-containing protein n=1 Tax=Amniculicola lignicola CBS 123094 TaxID=1392246 RepID=A0A6A5WAL2_9PLEO|nr:Mis6-domain-containing protein [Amniculicola lignicola CBS 123094]
MPSIVDSGAQPESLRAALEALEEASRTPTKQRTVKVSSIVDAVCRHAFEDGLDAEALRTVVRIAGKKTELDQTSVTTLVKNLYPSVRVPPDVIVTAVGGLGQGKSKPSAGTQNGLVRWLTTVYEILEEPQILSRLYCVLFGMLDMISIRTSLCHLLILITRRKHVKPFRIQQLLELSRGLGNEPALQGLLRSYRDYYPDIILGSATTSRNSFPPQPDHEWKTRLDAVQEATSAGPEATLQQHSGFKVVRRGPKRSRVSVIPEVHTYYTNETSVTLEEIDCVEDFVEKLDRIEPPGQLISCLTDPLLQKFLALNPSEIARRRLDLWLSTCLEEEYNAADQGIETSSDLSEILKGLWRHAQYTKELLPIVPTFLKAYLPIWSGTTDVEAIFGLLSYLPLYSFKRTYTAYLVTLEKALIGKTPDSYIKLVGFYTELLRHWITRAKPTSPDVAQRATSSGDQKILNDLVSHVSTLSTSLLLSVPPSISTPLASAILSFYELLSTSSSPHRIPIILPPPYLIYTLAQSPSTDTVSRICGVLASHKLAFNNHPTPVNSYYPSSITRPFNFYLKDIHNLIWVSRAFQATEGKSNGFYIRPGVRDALDMYLADLDRTYNIGLAGRLTHNPLLASSAAAAWRELEGRVVESEGLDRESVAYHKGPVSEQALKVLPARGGVEVEWETFRREVLRWLADRGLEGVEAFVSATTGTGRRNEGMDRME